VITRFVLALADGSTVIGEIHGSGGTIRAQGAITGDTARARLERAIARANAGKPTGLYEPKLGHARAHVNSVDSSALLGRLQTLAADLGLIDVDLRGARIIAVHLDDEGSS